MIKYIKLDNAVLSNVTGLDAIQRAPIVSYETNHRCLRIQNVSHNEPYEKWGFTEVSDTNFVNFQLKKDDIIISRTGGSIGSVMYISEDYNSVFNNGLIRLRIDKKHFNPKFIFYCLKNKQFEKHILHCSLGNSTQENIRMDDMLEYRIPDYSLDVQNKISSILWEIDGIINNNIAICNKLEAIAKLLYDYWFVQFDFPDENGKPYKSSGGKMVWNEKLKRKIPVGWEVKAFKDIAYFIMGQSPKGDSYNLEGKGLPLLNGAVELAKDGIHVEKYTEDYNRVCNVGDWLFCVRATLGNIHMADAVYCLGRGVASLKPKLIEYNEYVYFILDSMIKHFEKSLTGSIIIGMTKDDIVDYFVICPSLDIIKSFHGVIESVFDKKNICEKENQQLASLRDFLLPMLMNGQVKIGKVGA